MPSLAQCARTPSDLGGAVARVPSILHAHDGDDGPRFVNLAHGHVGEADVRDLALGTQARELAHALGERHGGIRCVELVDVDPIDAQRSEAGLAGASQVAGRALRVQAPFGRSRPPLVATTIGALLRSRSARAMSRSLCPMSRWSRQ